MHIITGEFLFQHAEGTAGDQPEAVAAAAEALDGFLVLVPDGALLKPPQSNSPPDIVPLPVHGNWLETQYYRGGIPTATPDRLASILLRLPPILYMQYRIPVSNWSKAPWGLSVLARVTSIFTGTSISPDALSRQRSNHYAFRAGRNLPDKEFRYLRTVIVTAAVYWGLNSKLRLR